MHVAGVVLVVGLGSAAAADEFSSDAIEQRAGRPVLTAEQKAEARIQGECLVGIKNINFAGGEFDPVAEWLRFRTTQLLEHHDPCVTLAMLEVAKRHLEADRSAIREQSQSE